MQDAETRHFLAPCGGDVGFVLWVNLAGVFDDLDAAEFAVIDHCDGDGKIIAVAVDSSGGLII